MGRGEVRGRMGKKVNLLILVADALRYDHFRSLNLQLPLVEFDNAFAVSLASEPNFVSLLTGLTPDEHGVYSNGIIDYDGPTLFTEMKKLGYHTISMLGYYALYRKGADKNMNVGCDATAGIHLQNVYDWIDEEPWCAMVRLMDTHNPYSIADKRVWRNRGDFHINPAALREKYKAAVVYLGQALNRFLEKILAKYPDTVIVITADHGEELLQHGMHKNLLEHHTGLWDTLVHVPLVVYHPEWSGRLEGIGLNKITASGLRQHHDLYRILGNLFGFHPNESPLKDSVEFAGMGYGEHHDWMFRGVRTKKWKCFKAFRPPLMMDAWLYDLEKDPMETTNLIDNPPPEAVPLIRRVGAGGPDDKVIVAQVLAKRNTMHDDVRRRLEGLGYL